MKKILKKYLYIISEKLPSALFIRLFNFYFYVQGLNTSLAYDKSKKLFTICEDNVSLTFNSSVRAALYTKGLKNRIDQLSKNYHLEKISFRKNDYIVDCGANIGEFYHAVARFEPGVDYTGIEPSIQEYSCLINNIKHNEAKNCALWHEDGSIKFYLASSTADSSIFRPKEFTEEVNVKACRLDSIIDRDIKLFKLEAEGAEPEIVRGLGPLLNRIDYISADLGPERGEKMKNTIADVTNYLLKENFEIIDVNTGRMIFLFKRKK